MSSRYAHIIDRVAPQSHILHHKIKHLFKFYSSDTPEHKTKITAKTIHNNTQTQQHFDLETKSATRWWSQKCKQKTAQT